MVLLATLPLTSQIASLVKVPYYLPKILSSAKILYQFLNTLIIIQENRQILLQQCFFNILPNSHLIYKIAN